MKKTWLALSLTALMPLGAMAQSFPTKPINIVVPYPPGGTADLLPRLVAEKMPDILGVPVIVHNRPGAAGIIGADHVARSEPDGYTLLVVPPHFFVSDLLYKVSFKPLDFKPVSILASYPNVLLATPQAKPNSLKELLSGLKDKSLNPTFASAGSGTSQHLSAVMLADMANVEYTHVPYKGTAPAIADLMAGHVNFMFDNLITALPLAQSGKLKLLGVGSPTRSKLLPDVPAINELVPGYESMTWMGIAAPPNTPDEAIAKVSQAIAQVIKEASVNQQIVKMQATPVGNTPAEMQQVVKQDTERWKQVVKKANIKPE